ncbi:AAA family ATPase [Pseudomonas sp. NPDC089534]|uniref:alpha/beta hydrolase n=1 Tax=Pseudomonas sp. NPDC089534 TaxID=3364468 RepID=UPI00381309ED
MTQNNTWHLFDSTTDTVFVFVHGFFSNSEKCWRDAVAKVFWPDLLLADPRIPQSSIFLGGYFTDADSGVYGVRECAEELYNALRRASHSGESPPLSFKKIIFICHSLGGIVTRYMLECYRESFADHKIGLVLMASPSIGSDYADRLVKVAKFYKNRTGLQLRKNSELLTDLDGRFKSFIDSRPHDSFLGIEGVEHTGLIHFRWLPGFEPIVMEHSASRYFSGRRIIPRTSHSSIVKPTDVNHLSHCLLLDFLSYTFFPKVGLPVVDKSSQGKLLREDVVAQGPLFDIYEESCEPYYLKRNIDEQVHRDFSFSSFWIYGPSGAGKTSIVKRLLSQAGAGAIELCFSQCTADRNSFVAEMIETIHLSENGFETMPERSFSNLARLISEGVNSNRYLFIYIDEVPSQTGCDTVEAELVALIEELLNSVKQLTKANSFRIVVSSLGEPNMSLVRNQAKLRGYMSFVECSKWTDEELQSLVDLILPNLKSLTPDDLPPMLIGSACGSPRYLKTFFKTKISYPHKSNDELLRMTAQGFQF